MIVLPMAGLSSRFFTAGYTRPKYMLDLHGRPVFAHAMGSFAHYFNTERFLIICRDVQDTPAFVRQECASFGIPKDRIDLVVLKTETAGQAATVALGLRAGGYPDRAATEPLTVFNIDTFRPGFRHPPAFAQTADGYLEVFLGEGDHWSFAKPDLAMPDMCRVVEVAEKKRISEYCSDGLYHFRTTEMFMSLYANIETSAAQDLQGGEHYIAPLYNYAIRQGCDIRYALIGHEEVRFCGTPAEYETLRQGAPFEPVASAG